MIVYVKNFKETTLKDQRRWDMDRLIAFRTL